MSYYPYGEERTSTADDREKFGTYMRDGPYQDYADQRYYAPWGGRFLTADPSASGDFTTPATLNQYAYVNGDPINFSDPHGLFTVCTDETCCTDGYDPEVSVLGQPVLAPMPMNSCGDGGGGGGGGGPVGGGGGSGGGSTPPPQPECFAQLKDRPVNDPTAAKFSAVHTFWWVQDETGTQYIISAGPTSPNSSGTQYLNVSVTRGSDNGSGDNSGAHMDWSSGLSWMNCDQVDAMLGAANNWKNNYNNTVQYHPAGLLGIGGPNSNSAAHYFGVVSGINPNPPTTAYGWWSPIVFP
jgi:RHS repeat-associated protein